MACPQSPNASPKLLDYLWRALRLPRKAIRLMLERHGPGGLEQMLQMRPGAFLKDLPESWKTELPTPIPPYRGFQISPRLLSPGHPGFPGSFLELHDPPWILYYQGNSQLLAHPGPRLAVVGTRRASDYARRLTAQWLLDCKPFHPLIISGMAWGIDGIAHHWALEAGLPTVGILGTPLERPYPPAHRRLFARMLREGLLLSELYSGATLGKWRFPERNRLLAALAEGILVVEAPEKSGALLTAQEGLELGREIFVLPGPLNPHSNGGGHRLIQDGAHLVTHPRELFEIMGYPSRAPTSPGGPASPPEDPLLEILRQGPLHVDKIVSISQKPAPEVMARLIELSLEGQVAETHPGFFKLVCNFN